MSSVYYLLSVVRFTAEKNSVDLSRSIIMNSQESLAIEALCNLSHMSVEKTSHSNNIETVNQKSKKEKKERKSYYVKKKDRIALNLPRFPMKPPMSYHQMPNTDPRCDLPRIICETLATDLDKFEALMNRIAVPDMLSVFQYDGKQNPYGPNYREVHGVQNFIDFYMAVMHGAPDCIFTIFKDSLRCSRNPDTGESFIVWRLMSIQTIVQIIQEKEPGEEERELGEILASQQNTLNAPNTSNSPTFTAKKQNSGTVDCHNGDNSNDNTCTNNNHNSNNNSHNSNSTSIYSIDSNSKSEQHAIETWNSGENYTVSKSSIRGNYVDCFAHDNSSNNSTKCSSIISGKNSTMSSTMSKSSDVSDSNSAAHTYPENATTNSTTATFSSFTNIEPMDININNGYSNSNNNITSTINSQQSHTFNSNLSSLVNNISDGSSTYSINNRLHNDYILKTSVLTNNNISATKNNLSAVHSATYNTANNSGKNKNKASPNSSNINSKNNNIHSVNSSNNSENNIEMDNLVSNFNSFKLSAVPTTERKTSYHYGTYIMELNADKKITKWYNFHKCLHHQPAFN